MKFIAAIFWILFFIAWLLLFAPSSQAHDSWINHGGYHNRAGEWCCGKGDCALMDKLSVTEGKGFYAVNGWGTIFGASEAGNIRVEVHENVPFSDAQPSPDGEYWRCQDPNKIRRCFFAPPGST